MKYKHVIWDWNGTLLNDVNLGHNLLNYLQRLKGVKLSSLEEYRKNFTFPITEFYKKVGMFENMDSFKKMAAIYIKKYSEGLNSCSLQKDAESVLKVLSENGITNSILTAGMEDMVIEQLDRYGISGYFIAVTGKQDYYASGKRELIEKHLKKIAVNPEEIIFVGDTLHDKQIAQEIGCDYIILRNGHQFIGKTNFEGAVTANNLNEAESIILG